MIGYELAGQRERPGDGMERWVEYSSSSNLNSMKSDEEIWRGRER